MRDKEKKKETGAAVEPEVNGETEDVETVAEKIEIGDGENGEKEPEEQIDLEKELETANQAASENHDRFLRVSAELENYKKRMAREMDGLKKFANESIIKQLLPVVDNLERAIESDKAANEAGKSPEELKNGIIEGVGMTLAEILKVFEKFGVKPISSVGEPFDPKFHEAVMQEETEDGKKDIVLREFHKGYMMHDRLLRPAMVIVSKPKSGTTEAETESSENEE